MLCVTGVMVEVSASISAVKSQKRVLERSGKEMYNRIYIWLVWYCVVGEKATREGFVNCPETKLRSMTGKTSWILKER